MKTLFDVSVSSAAGIEAVTKRELSRLGVENAPAYNGRLNFKADLKKIAECNLYLRTANRVYIVITSFKAENFDELFGGTFEAEWADYIPRDGKIIVSGKCVSSKLMAYSACQSVVKKAICEKLSKKYPTLPETGERYKVEVSVLKDFVTISLDTTGEGLHRRGYREIVGDAPLKETVAAALIDLSVWKPSKPFADIFCGSGTLPIEAALIASNIPAGLNRSFDFLKWKNFDTGFFGNLKDKAKSEIIQNPNVDIYGCDIDEKQLSLAKTHAFKAGVGHLIRFEKADMRDFSPSSGYGVLIDNPPYGERLSDRKEIIKLYRDYGKVYSKIPTWSCYTLTSVEDFPRLFGRKADKIRKLYNGKLECGYYSFLGEKPPRSAYNENFGSKSDKRTDFLKEKDNKLVE